MLEQFPAWLLCIGVIAAVALSVRAGMYVARRYGKSGAQDEAASEGIGAVVGALLGLLAFMLAFTFGIAADRRETRKHLLLEEVNSIRTTYLRAGLIPEPQRSDSRAMLRKYVDLRLEAAEHPEQMQSLIEAAAKLHEQLWLHAESLAEADLKNADIVSLYIDSLNETIDLQNSRLMVSAYRIPGIVWCAFSVLILLGALAVGYNFGLQSDKKHVLMTLMLAIALATVMFLIFDLDRGNQGWLKVDQHPMFELLEQMRHASPQQVEP